VPREVTRGDRLGDEIARDELFGAMSPAPHISTAGQRKEMYKYSCVCVCVCVRERERERERDRERERGYLGGE
jgi:hypothetical protein